MSVVSCSEIPSGQWADSTAAGRSWMIKTDNYLDHPIGFVAALQLSGDLPYIGSGHPENPYLRCASPGPRLSRFNGNDKFKWIATAEYKLAFSEQDRDEQVRQDTPNPTSRPPKIVMSFDRTERVVTEERKPSDPSQTIPILNAAGDPFLDPVVVPASTPRWHITFLSASYPHWLCTFADKANSDSITVKGEAYAAGQLLFEPGDVSDQQEENGVTFYEGQFSLLVNKEGWKERRVQNGLNEQVSAGTRKVKRRIRIPTHDPATGNALDYDSEDREYASDPQPLDANGALIVLAPGEVWVDKTSIKTIECFEQTAFAAIPGAGT